MEKNKLVANGLKCDTPGCDYHDDTPEEEYVNSIGRPCPKCGASLLTQECYDAFKSLSFRMKQHEEDLQGFSQTDIENIARTQMIEAGWSEEDMQSLFELMKDLDEEDKELVISLNATPDGKVEITGISEREKE